MAIQTNEGVGAGRNKGREGKGVVNGGKERINSRK